MTTNAKPIAVKVEHLSKTFKIPTESSSGIKQKLINVLKGKKGYRDFTPLKDISFEIEEGDFFGIVGRNGSGKSTLLKSIASIYTPTKGSVKVNGTLVPFIELGVGFNPELTGRENVFLNGALLGFSHTEMEAMYSEIVEFSEIGDFMGEKLKNYSSGMQVRLAFSIAIRARADILLLDEVLAVGDEAFQRKCYSYFDQLKRQKKTVILVTHDMNAVERFCNKALMIESGKIKIVGKPHKVAAAYSRSNDEGYLKTRGESVVHDVFDIAILNAHYQPTNNFNHNEEMIVRLSWKLPGVRGAGVAILSESGQYIYGPNTHQDMFYESLEGEIYYKVKLNLHEGNYFLKAALTGKSDTDTIAYIEEGPSFTVKKDVAHGNWGGTTRLQSEWGVHQTRS